jgi:hypothetical protein
VEQLTPAVASLLEQAMQQPAHFTPLRRGHLESVAALFQVHPFVVSELREQLRRPELRRAVADQLVRVRRARRPAHPRPSSASRVPPTVSALLDAVKAMPGGTELFLNAPTETVATLFGVHPFVVDAARAVATQHEARPEPFSIPLPRPSSPYWLPAARA